MRSLLLLFALVACDSGPTPASALRGERILPGVTVMPGVTATSPVAPAPAAAAALDAMRPSVEVARLVDALPPLQGRALRSNPALDELLSTATRGEVPDVDSYDILVDSSLAIASDPGSAVARFTHACLLAERGLHDLALKMVQSLRATPDCPACSDALFNVAYSTCGFDVATRDVVAAQSQKPSPLRTTTWRVLAGFVAGDPTGLAELVDDTVTVRSACSVCDEDRVTARKLTPSAFAAWVRSADGPAGGDWFLHGPAFLFCEGRCCTGPTGMLSHSSSFVTSVCYKDATAEKLSSIDMIDG